MNSQQLACQGETPDVEHKDLMEAALRFLAEKMNEGPNPSKPVKDVTPLEVDLNKLPVVYLAGGFRSNWQDKVMQAVPELSYIDPRTHGLTDPDQYTKWDLDAIKRCDILFGYMETTNPGGFNLAFEVGYAEMMGRGICFVNEVDSRYWSMIESVANVYVPDLDTGIEMLRDYKKWW